MKGRSKIILFGLLAAFLILLLGFYYGCRSGSEGVYLGSADSVFEAGPN